MTLDFKTSRVSCPHCGYVRPDEISRLENKEHEVKQHGAAPYVSLIHKGEIDGSAYAAFDSGQDALFKGDKAEALKCFQRAVDYQEDFTDAHLWIAKVADDPKIKRDELGIVLTYSPNNLEALRMIMVLDGRLTPEQAAQTYHDNDQLVQHTSDTVETKVAELLCPNCGGDLTVNDALHRVECRFCGYSAPLTAQRGLEQDNLAMALLERKAKPMRWNVGQRLIKCQQCGAEQTINAAQMSERCKFCGANAVILSDALGSFTQPEGLVPFAIDLNQAQAQVNQALNSLGEKLVGLFTKNKVEHSTLEGVYLPFWSFDVLSEVTRIKRIDSVETDRNTYAEQQFDLNVCAVKSPPDSLTAQLGLYDLDPVKQYEPKWLAKYPAQLYSIDFDEASLLARSLFSTVMKQKYARSAEDMIQMDHNRYQDVNIQVYTQATGMQFRLLLLPVWIGTLIEVDGDMRLVLVNGQTGHVSLGKAHRA